MPSLLCISRLGSFLRNMFCGTLFLVVVIFKQLHFVLQEKLKSISQYVNS